MKNIQFATFGGGCFWGVEKFLQNIPGAMMMVLELRSIVRLG